MVNIEAFDCDINPAEILTFLNTGQFGDMLRGQDINIYVINAKHKKFFYERWYGSPYKYPGDDAFRAWAAVMEREIFIFVDQYETLNSIYWLIIHELTHMDIYITAIYLIITSALSVLSGYMRLVLTQKNTVATLI